MKLTGFPSWRLLFVILQTLLLLGIAGVGEADDWPRFRGPEGDGTVPAEAVPKVPKEWSATKNLIWKTDLPGAGSSSPIVTGDKVYLTCYSGYGLDATNAGDPEELRRHAVCVSLESGEILWDHVVKPAGPQTVYEGRYITTHGYASSSAVSDGRGVYFFLGDSGVYAFTLDGRLVWEASVGTGSHDWGSGASPVLHGDLLIVNGASESDALVAFDKKTGKEMWKYEGIPRAWNTPTITEVDGKSLLLLANQRSILGIDPETGRERWQAPGIRAAELCPSIVVRDGIAYQVGSPKGEALALRIDGSGAPGPGDIVWRIQKGSNVVSPVVHDGHVYFANDGRGVLYCVRANDGEVIYEERLPSQREKVYASPILVGDVIYYLGRSGVTYLVPASPDFKILATNSLEDGSVFNASPAVAGGRLLIRSDKALYCIGDLQ